MSGVDIGWADTTGHTLVWVPQDPPRRISRGRSRRAWWIGRRCHYCDRPASGMDHIVPWALGGPNAIWNLVPACTPCNGAKAATMPTCQCRGCLCAVRMARWAASSTSATRGPVQSR